MEYDWLPLTGELYQELADWKEEQGGGEFVFPNPETGRPWFERGKWMRRLCRKAGVKPFGIHAIRHLTASILADSGEPIAKIQRILRHKRQATTERYLHQLFWAA